MALRYLEGWEHIDVNVLRYNSNDTRINISTSPPAGRSHSSGCLYNTGNANAGTEKFSWDAANDNSYWGFAYYADSMTVLEVAFFVSADVGESNVNVIGLETTATGELKVFRHTQATTGGTQLGSTTATNTLLAATWHYIEVLWDQDNTTGQVTVWVDGVQVFDVTSADTQAAASKGTEAWFAWSTNLTGDPTNWHDDMYMLDTNTTSPQTGTSPNTSRLGDIKVEPFHPTGDTADEDWTLQAGTDSFAMVDDTDVAPDGDTTYIESNVVTDITRLTLEDSALTGTIHGVSSYVCARKTSANAREIDVKVTTNAGTNYDDDTLTLAETYQAQQKVFDRAPGASVADWADAKVDSLEVAVEVIT